MNMKRNGKGNSHTPVPGGSRLMPRCTSFQDSGMQESSDQLHHSMDDFTVPCPLVPSGPPLINKTGVGQHGQSPKARSLPDILIIFDVRTGTRC